MVGLATIELKDLLEDVALTKTPLAMNKSYYKEVLKKRDKNLEMNFDSGDDQKLWLTLYGKGKKGKTEKRGKIAVKIEVMPIDHATKNPVGKARNLNVNPTLPPPEGRLELSMNPLKIIN